MIKGRKQIHVENLGGSAFLQALPLQPGCLNSSSPATGKVPAPPQTRQSGNHAAMDAPSLEHPKPSCPILARTRAWKMVMGVRKNQRLASVGRDLEDHDVRTALL